MRYYKKSYLIVLLFLLVLASTIPFSANANNFSYPDSINGYPVIYIQTSENTYGLSSREVVLTILDKSAKTTEESMTHLNLKEYLKNNPLPKGYSIEVYGGPGASKEEFEKVHNKINEELKKIGPILLGGPGLFESNTKVAGGPTFATFANNDPASQVVTEQRARWYAPVVGSSQNAYSAFLVNGMTNVNRYFLQSGQVYIFGTGFNMWADTTTGLSTRPFNVSYVPFHLYEFSIVYSPAGGFWSLWCEDYTASIFDYYYELNATGTSFINDPNTCVFFENWNTNANWYTGFIPNPMYAFYARDYVAQWKAWNSGQIYIIDSAGNYLPNNNIIIGSLVNYGYAYWYLNRILLRQ